MEGISITAYVHNSCNDQSIEKCVLEPAVGTGMTLEVFYSQQCDWHFALSIIASSVACMGAQVCYSWQFGSHSTQGIFYLAV